MYLSGAIDDMSCCLDSPRTYSNESNLTLNATKTKWMLVPTPQMSRYHALDEKQINITACSGRALERVVRCFLGLTFRLRRACNFLPIMVH